MALEIAKCPRCKKKLVLRGLDDGKKVHIICSSCGEDLRGLIKDWGLRW